MGNELLFKAINAKDNVLVSQILEDRRTGNNGCPKFDLDAPNSKRVNPLHLAVRMDNPEVCRLLIENGAAIDWTDKNGRTPLLRATSLGYPGCVRVLIDHGANINAANDRSETSVRRAVARDNAQILALLLDAGADTAPANKSLKTMVELAISYRATKALRILSERGFLDDAFPDDALLIEAVRSDNKKILAILAKAGINLDQENEHGRRPLHYAAISDRQKAVRFLLDHGVKLDNPKSHRQEPLPLRLWAKGKSREIIMAHIASSQREALRAFLDANGREPEEPLHGEEVGLAL